MQNNFTITDVDQLKALADPLRQRIMNALCCQPATTKQIAEQLGEKPTRLYHHVEQLETAGLIQLVETRQNRGTIEKYYVSVARQFVVDRKLLNVSSDNADALIKLQSSAINILQTGLADLCNRLDTDLIAAEDNGTAMCCYAQVRLSKTQARELINRISQFVADCESLDGEDNEQMHTLAVAFFPVRDE